jgi:hypothetical protein
MHLKFPPRLIEAPRAELAGDFLRTWRISGPAMCEALRKAGIETTDWKPSAVSRTSYECSFERIYKEDGTRPMSSIFLLIRGDASGAISNMRVKIVEPATSGAGQLDPAVMQIFETLLEQPHWLDFHDTLEAIRSLKDVKEDGFGASITFAKEFTSENSFNFTLALKAEPGPQTRTRTYFSSGRWMHSPDSRVSETLPPIFR